MLPQEVGKGCPSAMGGSRAPSLMLGRAPLFHHLRGLAGLGFQEGAKGWRWLEFPLQLRLV